MMPHRSERGAALVAVLAMVLLLAGFASLGLQRLKAATDRALDARALAEAQLLADAGVRAALPLVLLAKAQAARRTDLLERPIPLVMGEGRVMLRLSDAGACFNLNSLSPRPEADAPDANSADFQKLLIAVGIPSQEAGQLARATAERLAAGGILWADASEWLTVPGVTASHWKAAAPLLCTLPVREPSAFNVNALTPEKAALLVALGLSPDEARRTLANRPAEGWASGNAFWSVADPDGAAGSSAAAVVGTTSRWMRLEVRAETAGARAARDVLLDTVRSPAAIAAVTWVQPPALPDGGGGVAPTSAAVEGRAA